MKERDLKKELIRFTKLLSEKELITGAEGNLSIKTNKGFWITPTGRVKEVIREKDLCFIDENGNFITGKPSSEWGMHFLIYKKNKRAKAVVHTHPIYGLCLNNLGFDFKKFSLKEAELILGHIITVPYYEPGSYELWEVTSDLACIYKVLFLEKHGLVTVGETLEEAVNLALIFEKLCKIEYKIKSLKEKFL